MSQKYVVARLNLKPGSKAQFTPVLKQLVESTHAEAGTLHYAAHFDGDDTVVFYEVYKDDEALAIHSRNLKKVLLFSLSV